MSAIICAWYLTIILLFTYRYRSRALVIPFQMPTIGPLNDTDVDAFCQLSTAQTNVSSAVGWAISLGRQLQLESETTSTILSRAKNLLPGIDPRLCMGYSLLIYFTQKVHTVMCNASDIMQVS